MIKTVQWRVPVSGRQAVNRTREGVANGVSDEAGEA